MQYTKATKGKIPRNEFGDILAPYDLPPANVRWVPGKKYRVLQALRFGPTHGFPDKETIQKRYSLSDSELAEWERVFQAYSFDGLRSTWADMYGFSSPLDPVDEFPACYQVETEAAGMLLCRRTEARRGQVVVISTGTAADLTHFELRLWELLLSRMNTVVTNAMFLQHLYGHLPPEKTPELKIYDVMICKLRKKFSPDRSFNLIEPVWGRGYVVRLPAYKEMTSKDGMLIAAE